MAARVFAVVFFFVVMGLSISCGVMRYNECRRLHPIWYCIGRD